MKCPHCLVQIHPSWETQHIASRQIGGLNERWDMASMTCPACQKYIHRLLGGDVFSGVTQSGHAISQKVSVYAYPIAHGRAPAPSEAPAELAGDYTEACLVLGQSPKSAAALARRCIQGILRQQGYPQHDLVKQIEAVLGETDAKRSLPTGLHNTIDAVRNFGNFSAHPMSDALTGEIIDVEDGEAEWCLEIILDLFDHYYVKPSVAARR